MAAAAATAAATLQVVPAAEDEIAGIEGVVNVFDRREVSAVTACQCNRLFECQCLQMLDN